VYMKDIFTIMQVWGICVVDQSSGVHVLFLCGRCQSPFPGCRQVTSPWNV